MKVLFESLSVAEREAIVGTKASNKVSTKDTSLNSQTAQGSGDTKSPSKSGKRRENKPPDVPPAVSTWKCLALNSCADYFLLFL